MSFKTNALLCAFLLSVVALSCKKKTKITTPVNADVKQHFSFKPGTYWIYRDSAAGVEDSFYVTSNGSNPEPDGTEYYASFVSVNENRADLSMGFHLHKDVVQIKFHSLDAGCSFTYPYWSVTDILPSFVVGAGTFDSVWAQKGTGIYYVKADIGIIKMRVEKDTLFRVWELQRYHIAK